MLLLTGIFLFSGLALFAQNADSSAIPQELLRPRYGEEPLFPKDYVIGELGRGDATEETYRMAREIVAGLAAGNGNIDRVVFPDYKRMAALDKLTALGVRSWRVGGGRSEGGGVYSFLVRFLGREKSITGELYLLWQEPIVEEEVSPETVKTSGVQSEPAKAAAEQTETPNITATPNGEAANDKAAPQDPAALARAVADGDASAESAADGALTEGGEKKDPGPIAGIATEVKEEPRLEDKPHWRVDDILLEPPRGLSDGKYGPGGRDMTPYERFF
jgi:hypothetical protein